MKRKNEEVAKWKEAKEITGMSASSIVDLKAAIASEKSSHATSNARRVQNATSMSIKGDSVGKLNAGVKLRAKRDAEMAAEEEARGSLSYMEEKLREKSRLYDIYVKGGALEPGAVDGEHLIDFERKNWEERSSLPPAIDEFGRSIPGGLSEPEFFHEDIQREAARMKWEEEARKTKEEEDAAREKRVSERMQLSQVIEETKAGRERAQQLQEERKRKLEMRKLQVQKRAQEQKERAELARKETEEAEAVAKAEREKKRLHLKK